MPLTFARRRRGARARDLRARATTKRRRRRRRRTKKRRRWGRRRRKRRMRRSLARARCVSAAALRDKEGF